MSGFLSAPGEVGMLLQKQCEFAKALEGCVLSQLFLVDTLRFCILNRDRG